MQIFSDYAWMQNWINIYQLDYVFFHFKTFRLYQHKAYILLKCGWFVYVCLTLLGNLSSFAGTCTRRGVCEDDADARSQQTAKNVTGFARDTATGAGVCNCSVPRCNLVACFCNLSEANCMK